jgi:hypothetical protein
MTPYEIQKSVVVPLIALGTLSSGRPLTVFVDREDRENILIDWGGGGAVPFTVSSEGGAPMNVNDPAAQQAVLQALQEHGVDPSKGSVDLRQMPAARAAVLDALRKHGVDAAHATAAADPSTSVEKEAVDEPLERLTKLMQLKNAQLITDEEFAQHKRRILEDV